MATGKNRMWAVDSEYDDLAVLDAEIEDLENDEINMSEAGFMLGYADDMYGMEQEDEYWEFADGV